MMALDCGAGDRKRFDAVGVNCTLGEPLHIFKLVGFSVEYVNKAFAYYLAFAFRIP